MPKYNYLSMREAITSVGPERIRRAMPWFDLPRSERRWGNCAKCFAGRAYGSGGWPEEIKTLGAHIGNQVLAHYVSPWAALSFHALNTPKKLRQECIAFLAEHGETPEPSAHARGREQHVPTAPAHIGHAEQD